MMMMLTDDRLALTQRYTLKFNDTRSKSATWVVDRAQFIDSNAISLRSIAGTALTRSFVRALSTGRRHRRLRERHARERSGQSVFSLLNPRIESNEGDAREHTL